MEIDEKYRETRYIALDFEEDGRFDFERLEKMFTPTYSTRYDEIEEDDTLKIVESIIKETLEERLTTPEELDPDIAEGATIYKVSISISPIKEIYINDLLEIDENSF